MIRRLRSVAKRRTHGLCDLAQRPTRLLAGTAQARERLPLAEPVLLHQQALRALDQLARLKRVAQRSGLVAQGLQLDVPGPRRLDRRQQVALAERLHQVAEHAGVDGAADQRRLRERGQHHDRDLPLLEHLAGGLDAVQLWHLDVHHRQVGLVLRGQRDRLAPVAGLGHHLEAGPLQHRPHVQPDDGLVLRDQDTAGNRTTAFPRRSMRPRSSSRTSAAAIVRPSPWRGPGGGPWPSSPTLITMLPPSRTSSTEMRPRPCSSALWNSSQNTSATAVARWPGSTTGCSRLTTSRPPRPCPSIASSRPISPAQSTSSWCEVVSRSCTAAIDRIRCTLSWTASDSSSDTRARVCSYSFAFSMACPTCPAIAVSSATSSSPKARGSRVRTFSAPSSRSRACTGTARIDSYSSSGRLGKPTKRASRCAASAIITGRPSAADVPVIPSPRCMRGRWLGSPKRPSWVARSSSTSSVSSYR